MIYRRDLAELFDWLEGSRYLDELLDEALVAVALTAYGHGDDLVWSSGWQHARAVVERYGLQDLAGRLRAERLL